jgi:hypothetical protein
MDNLKYICFFYIGDWTTIESAESE